MFKCVYVYMCICVYGTKRQRKTQENGTWSDSLLCLVPQRPIRPIATVPTLACRFHAPSEQKMRNKK